jgi:hypothetical protein
MWISIPRRTRVTAAAGRPKMEIPITLSNNSRELLDDALVIKNPSKTMRMSGPKKSHS